MDERLKKETEGAAEETAGNLRVVVIGLAKTGTTALHYEIQEAMPPGTRSLFEPVTPEDILPCDFGDRSFPINCKLIVNKPEWKTIAELFPQISAFYDRIIFLLRDPRDQIVSQILYAAYGSNSGKSLRKIFESLALLQKKEADPAGVSLDPVSQFLRGETLDEMIDRWIFFSSYLYEFIEVTAEQGLICKYEDYVAGDRAALTEYLGFPLKGSVKVPSDLRRVERRKTSGDWRNWFTEDDYALFLKKMKSAPNPGHYDFFARSSSQEQKIDPAYASHYVWSLFNEQRAKAGLGPLPGLDAILAHDGIASSEEKFLLTLEQDEEALRDKVASLQNECTGFHASISQLEAQNTQLKGKCRCHRKTVKTLSTICRAFSAGYELLLRSTRWRFVTMRLFCKKGKEPGYLEKPARQFAQWEAEQNAEGRRGD